MDIQRQAFQEWYIANHHDGDIHPNQQLLEWSEKGGFYFASSVEDLWEAWQAAKAQKVAVPDGFVLVPKLSANYLFNIVPELGFKHQDQKDTVLYHLNYMASEFKDSAKKFIEADHAKQKEMIKAQEPAND